MLDPATEVLLIVACGTLLGGALWVEAQVTTRPTLFSPLVFLVAILIFAYGIRSILTFNNVDQYADFAPYYKPHDLTTFVEAYIAFLLGTVALICGYASGTYAAINKVLPSLKIASARRLAGMSLLAMIAGCALFLTLVPKLINTGAVLALFASNTRMAVASLWKGEGDALFLLMDAPLLLACYLEASKLRGFRAGRIAIVAVLVVLLAVAFGFIGSRGSLMALLLVLVLFIHYRIRRIPLWLQATFAAVLVLLSGALGLLLSNAFRLDGDTSITEFLRSSFVRFTGTFDQFESLFAYIQKSEHFYFGWSFVEDLFWTYVPRAVFPFKPELFGAVRLENAIYPDLYRYAGVSATYPVGFFGEAYGNLQVAGLIIFPFLFGALLRALVNRAQKEADGGLYRILVIGLLSTGPGLARAMGGSVLWIALNILMLMMLFCIRFSISAHPYIGSHLPEGASSDSTILKN